MFFYNTEDMFIKFTTMEEIRTKYLNYHFKNAAKYAFLPHEVRDGRAKLLVVIAT